MYKSNKSSYYYRPVVGVIVSSRYVKSLLLSKKLSGFKDLVEANKEANTNLNVFSTEDVDLVNRTVNGTFYNHSKSRWESEKFPLPNVVYVRGGGGVKVRKLLEQLEKLGTKKINPIVAFNKGELYQKLKNDEKVRSFLPATETVENMDEIKTMILKLGKVYVKACRGRKGTKVMRIEKLQGGGYQYSYSILGKLLRRRVPNMKSLEKAVSLFFKDKKVIVQKAIDLVRVDRNRLVDFRAELQRNKEGEIEITGISVRVGQRNSPITTHGEAYRYETYLKKLFPKYSAQKIKILNHSIVKFLLNIYAAVEKTYGKFGEIGIDFAVDRKGEIWLIECNAQSAKVSIRKAYKNRATKVFLNPLEYAKTIAETNRSRSSFVNRSFHRSGF
jgi:hypothetical protein